MIRFFFFLYFFYFDFREFGTRQEGETEEMGKREYSQSEVEFLLAIHRETTEQVIYTQESLRSGVVQVGFI